MVEFKQAMKFYGIIDYEMWDFEASLNIHFPSEELGDRVGKLINSDNWSKIVTHNPIGEYGNIQHKDVFDSVRKNTDEFYVFCKTTKRLDDDAWNRKQKVLDIYNETQDSYFKSDNLEFQYWYIFPDNTTSYQEHGTISLYDKNKDTTEFISCVDKYENYKFNRDRSSYIPNPGEISYGSLGFNSTEIRNTSEEELEYQSNEVESYFKYCDVNEGDVVVDLGACIGLVTLRMLEKNPSRVYSVEAADLIYQDLYKNVESYDNVTPYKLLIGEEKNKVGIFSYTDKDNEVKILSFYEFVKQNKIDKIDFMKMDIEGAEYEIFNDDESSNWIKDNVKNIVGEIHLRGRDRLEDNREEFPHLIDKIKELGFDLILNSCDGVDITEQLINNFWLTDKDQNAIDYYTEVLFYASKKVVVNNLIEEPIVMEAI
jgi:FkbM family methyltransferase